MKLRLNHLIIIIDWVVYAILLPLVCQPILFIILLIPSLLILSVLGNLIKPLSVDYLLAPSLVIISAWLVNLVGYQWAFKWNYFQNKPRWFMSLFVLAHALIWIGHGVLFTLFISHSTDACYDTPVNLWSRELTLTCSLWQKAPLFFIPYSSVFFIAFFFGYRGHLKRNWF